MGKPISLKDQLKDQLEKKGTLTAEDLQAAQTQQDAAEQPAPGDEMDRTSRVKVSDKELDGLVQGAGGASTDERTSAAMVDRSEVPEDQFALVSDLDAVDITPEDKRHFTGTFVDGTRFTRPFSLMGGKVTGVFRCRTAGESRAIIEELVRQGEKINETVYENATKMRYALLHCMLAELNHVSRPEWQEPLMAVQKIDVATRKVTAEPPAWYQEMQIMFDRKMDGLVNALYGELKKFEKVYWTLVRNVANQDFWRPEDSTIG